MYYFEVIKYKNILFISKIFYLIVQSGTRSHRPEANLPY